MPEEVSNGEPGAAYYGADRVRRSLKHFLLGRGISSVASFLVAILIVRELAVDDYAGYTALSGLLMTLALVGTLGLDRAVTRYFPVLRQKKAEHQLRRFCWSLFGLRAVVTLAAIGLLWLVSRSVGRHIALPDLPDLMFAFGVYVLGFTLSKHATVSLQALLLNKEATTGMSIEWLAKLAVLLVWLGMLDGLELEAVLWIHGLTAMCGAVYMIWGLFRHLGRQVTGDERNQVLDRTAVTRLARQNYLWTLTGYHTSPSISKLMGAYLLTAPATAALGFAYALTGVLRRYLPANLLLGLIEPVVMARYSADKNFDETMKLISIVLKLNLFLLLPATVWFMLAGGPVIETITGGKYGDSAWLVSGLMILLILQSHGLILQLICNAVERSDLLLRSNLWSWLLVPGLVAVTMYFGLAGLIAGVLSIVAGKQLYVVVRLRGLGFPFRLEGRGIARIVGLAVAAAVSGVYSVQSFQSGLTGSILGAVVTAVLFLATTFVWKPFTEPERETLNRLIGRRLFVW